MASWTTMPLLLLALLFASFSEPLPLEHLRHLDWHRGLRPGERCPAKCQPELCPDPSLLQSCISGRVRDPCGCCWECGNGEGQLCDTEPWSGSTFFGRCAEGLRCKAPSRDPAAKEEPKPVCVCSRQEMLCGSDGRTYENVCQLRAAQRRTGEQPKITVGHHGPCKAKPIITYAPRDIITLEGSDVLLSCEVSSYPLASIQWRKEGDSIFLTADDSGRAVQARGGPRRFELTGWLQIHRVGPNDAGVYTCSARNAFGEVSASARLRVVHKASYLYHRQTPTPSIPEFPMQPPSRRVHVHSRNVLRRHEFSDLLVEKDSQQSSELSKTRNEVHRSFINEAESEDDEDYEGQASGYMYL